MPHIFLHCPHFNGDNRFQTHSAILDVTPYKPQVLILGTYNDGNNVGNNADFFYGRNYFWPVISNLSNNANILTQRRDRVGLPPGNPVLAQILNLSEQFKLTFADIISDVTIPLPNHNDNHLNGALGNNNAISNHQSIIEYINRTLSITHVYSTTKFNGQFYLNNTWEQMETHIGNSYLSSTFPIIFSKAFMFASIMFPKNCKWYKEISTSLKSKSVILLISNLLMNET
jgi:hypothetical protein